MTTSKLNTQQAHEILSITKLEKLKRAKKKKKTQIKKVVRKIYIK